MKNETKNAKRYVKKIRRRNKEHPLNYLKKRGPKDKR